MIGLARLSRQLRAASKGKNVEINKILIANRGEIACRIIETARRMGVKTVAVHCDAESHGKHVQMADEAYRLGPPPATSSYLKGNTIAEIAKEAGAQAIHPGYGFLSENADFAKLCEEKDIEFIGPPASAIISMGSKAESKEIMEGANVPCVPGYRGEDQTHKTLQEKADAMGYPLLIKAVLGGGGKGMRIVRNKESFLEELEGAKREAVAFFKDDRVLLERYIERSRHVEVQVFCDKHGNGVYLFERDCSVQRRHQKVLEEAPAPGLTSELRKEMGECAVRAAKAVNYVGAGTVEFIFDVDTNDYYFMEMNTRLQVEHPVTEMVTGLDLVKLQIEIARGEPLHFTQEELELSGHAIEARIYAEDPYNNFLPGSGTLQHVTLPQQQIDGTTIRIDSGFRSGDDVLVHYDPMIAKLIVHAPTRKEALEALDNALAQYHVVGIPTNIEFLRKAVQNSHFAAGGVSTSFIAENEAELLVRDPLTASDLALGAVACMAEEFHRNRGELAPFNDKSFFRLNSSYERTISFMEGEKKDDVVIVADSEHELQVTAKGKSMKVRVVSWDSEALIVSVDGVRHEYQAVSSHDSVSMLSKNGTVKLFKELPPPTFGDTDSLASGGRITAPMPGKIIKVVVKNGDTVKVGDDILVLEAMKMEQKLKATANGVVDGLTVKPDTMVSASQLLATIKSEDDE